MSTDKVGYYNNQAEETGLTVPIIKRNFEIARLYAMLTKKTFIEETDVRKSDTVLVPNDMLKLEEARLLGINKSSELYGGVGPDIYSVKSIFHKPYPGSRAVPRDFPFEFQEYLSEKGLVLPGYLCFTFEDMEKAFHELDRMGYMVRLKFPIGSSGEHQYIINRYSQIYPIIGDYPVDYLKRFGIILEANLVSDIGDNFPPKSFSAGWLEIGGEIYSYVGRQDMNESGRYLGTTLHLIKGVPKDLPKYINDKKMYDVANHLTTIADGIHLLPGLICSRYNFDFVVGKLYTKDPDKSPIPQMCVTDQSFRVGGASVAELMAVMHLQLHPDDKIVSASSHTHYGERAENTIPQHGLVIFDGDDGSGGQLQIWGQLLGVDKSQSSYIDLPDPALQFLET